METPVDFIGITPKRLAALSKDDFVKYVESVIKSKSSNKANKLAIKFPYSLTTTHDDKLADRHPSCKYTVFVNNAGTIAHLFSSESDETFTRIRIKPSIKHLSKKRMLMVIWQMIRHSHPEIEKPY